jgi:hypothetical protein
MSQPERALWGRLKAHLPGEAERTENVAGSGMPDVYAVHNPVMVGRGESYWVELKVSNRARRVVDPVPLLRPSQLAWHARFAFKGATILVLDEGKNEYSLFIRSKGPKLLADDPDYHPICYVPKSRGSLSEVKRQIERILLHA